jgi:hypothetical protein
MFALKQEPEVAGFWAWFDENQARLAHVATTLDDMKMDDLEPVLTELADILHEADERLFAELGADAAGKPQLVVTADGELDAMLTARDLVAIAPAYDGWTFSALRERAEVPETIMLPGGAELDMREAVFVLEVTEGKAEIAIGLDQWDDARADDYNSAVEFFVEQVLGEADYAAGVAGVMALPLADLQEEAGAPARSSTAAATRPSRSTWRWKTAPWAAPPCPRAPPPARTRRWSCATATSPAIWARACSRPWPPSTARSPTPGRHRRRPSSRHRRP